MSFKGLNEILQQDKTQVVYEEATFQGLVVKTQSGFYAVQTEVGQIVSQISGRLKEIREDTPLTSDLVALGDRVTIQRQADGSGLITEVTPRQHVLSRVDPSSAVGTSAENEQIIVANCDQAIFVLAATHPRPQPRMLDRLLVVAEKAALESIVICINKMDMAKHPQRIREQFAPYEAIGYPVLYVSAQANQGMDTLYKLLQNKISVLTGPSGVGKSSILNATHPELNLQTGDVSQANQKGRHTTRFSQLIPLNGGGYIADTPGIRAIAPWDVEPDELDSYFREIRPLVADCKFTDCSHIHEPGCAVRQAVDAHQISRLRYDSYLRLRDELEEQYVYL